MALLEARGLVKIFGKLTALNGADLTVAENEFHGLIGPNGSGKSTLMKCVAGAEIPTSGTVTFGGRDISQASPAERARAGMSLKFQITSVLPALTLYDNILLALQAQTSLPRLVFSRTRGILHDPRHGHARAISSGGPRNGSGPRRFPTASSNGSK